MFTYIYKKSGRLATVYAWINEDKASDELLVCISKHPHLDSHLTVVNVQNIDIDLLLYKQTNILGEYKIKVD